MLRDKVYPDEGISTNLIEKRTKSLDFNTLSDDEWKCKSCPSLSSNNDSLETEIRKLREKTQSLEAQMLENQSVVSALKTENLLMKKDIVLIIQDLVSRGDDFDMNIEYNRHYRKVLDMLEAARDVDQKLPDIQSAMSSVYTDQLGFTHGERESPVQAFYYCCSQLKEYYIREAKEKELRQKWEVFFQKTTADDLEYSEELLQLVIEGLPSDIRPGLWKRLMSNKVKHIKEAKACKIFHHLRSHGNPFPYNFLEQLNSLFNWTFILVSWTSRNHND